MTDAERATPPDVTIVGGGIAGLHCARRLADAGQRILILEASSDRWGGRIETEELDGFLAEMGPMRFEPTCADHDGHGMVMLYMDRPATEFCTLRYSDYQGFIEGALNSAELALGTLVAPP